MDRRPRHPREPHHFPRGKCSLGLLILLVLFVLLGTSLASAREPQSPPTSVHELMERIRDVYARHDPDALHELINWEGTNSSTRETQFGWFRKTVKDSLVFLEFDDTPVEAVDVTDIDGTIYRVNMNVVGKLNVRLFRGHVWSTNFPVGEKNGVYLIPSSMVIGSVLPPGEDPLANQVELSAETRGRLDAYYYMPDRKWVNVRSAVKVLDAKRIWDTGHPNPTIQARGVRFAMLVLENSLAVEREPAIPDSSRAAVSVEGVRERTRTLRKEVVDNIAYPHRGSLRVVDFFLEREPSPALQPLAVEILSLMKPAESDSAVLYLVEHPHRNGSVTARAVELAAERGLKPSPESLRRFEQDDNPHVAYRARTLNDSLGYPAFAPYDSARVVRSDRISGLMARIDSLVVYPASPNTPFVAVVWEPPRDSLMYDDYRFGWLTHADSAGFELNFSMLALKHGEWKGESNSVGEHQIARLDTLTLDEAVEALGERYDRHSSFYGELRAVYSTVFSYWLFQKGEDQQCARLILPVLDEYEDPNRLLILLQEAFTIGLGPDMLKAYAVDRDYDRTLVLAERIVERYPASSIAPTAKRLLKELPLRAADFNTLRLPTPAEWESIKQELSHEDQVRYLCERLRLLNWYGQNESKWDISTQYDPQFAEFDGIHEEPDVFGTIEKLRPGETEVINPYLLLGETKISDIPIIAPYLLEDWLTLGVNEDEITTTSYLIADLFDSHMSYETNIQRWGWEDLTRERQEAEVARIIEWAETNK